MKGVIVILVILLLLTGGLGGYGYYTLDQQLKTIDQQLTASQEEQAARIVNVTDELAAFKGEALNKIAALGEEIGKTDTKIDALKDEIRDMAANLSQTGINATEIYQSVSQATVRISDGKRTIGSGFVLDTKGHVVTANHIVEVIIEMDSPVEIEVILPDGSISTATIAGRSPYSDVAVLKLEDELAVEPLTLGDSDTVISGEPVVAIGNPFEMTETLTSGVVSHLDRYHEFEFDSKSRWVANLIQFDAPINPGNAGGPLFNPQGEIIGLVIGAIEPDVGQGISYAVSVNMVKRVATALISRGSFDYPWIGADVTDLTPQVVRESKLDTINGTLVAGISGGGPARDAGIKVDDVIVAIDGKAIKDAGDLMSYLGEHKSPDEEATLTLMRNEAKLDLTLEIGKR